MRIHLAGKGERAGCLHAARKLFFLKWKFEMEMTKNS